MKKIKENKFLVIIIIFGVIIFAFVASMLLSSNKKITAVVPAGTIEASTTITGEMIKEIEIDADTPGNFVRNPESIIGSKTKATVRENQLLYESDFMSSFTDFQSMETIDEDFVITTFQVPDERAVGGIITAGDFVDVLIVYKEDQNGGQNSVNYANTWLNSTNTNANYVLANVLVLSTNSALSASQGSEMGSVQAASATSSEDEGSFYVVALCYNDYMKLRIAESSQNTELWLNLCPRQNETNDPLINQMSSNRFAYLHDAQDNVMDKNGNMLVDEYYETDSEGMVIDRSDERLNEGLFEDADEQTSGSAGTGTGVGDDVEADSESDTTGEEDEAGEGDAGGEE